MIFGALALVSTGVGVAAIPYAAPLLVESIGLPKVEERLGVELNADGIEVTAEKITFHNLVFRGEGYQGAFDSVVIGYQRPHLFSTDFSVGQLEIDGGEAQLRGRGIEQLRERFSASAKDNGAVATNSDGDSSDSRLPKQIDIRNVSLDVENEGMGRATGQLEMSGSPTGVLDVHLNGASVELHGGRHAAARRLGIRVDRRGSLFPLTLEFDNVQTEINERIALAGVWGWIRVDDPSVQIIHLDAKGGFSGGMNAREKTGPSLWSVGGSVRRDMTEGKIALNMESFELGRVPQVLERLPVVSSEQATTGGRVELEFKNGKIDVEGNIRLDGLNVSHPLLSPDVVTDIGFEMEVDAQLDPAASSVKFNRATLNRGGVSLLLEGEFAHPEHVELRKYDLRLTMEPTSCQAILDAIPHKLVPSLRGFRLKGKMGMKIETKVDFMALDETKLGGSFGIRRCRVAKAPGRVGSSRLMGGFSHRVTMRDGQERLVRLFPGSSTFTPLEQISPNMVAAVLTTEDGSFWRHRGFLPSQFEVALRRNLKEGRVRIGASTITMQMVKNVLLSHERTISRKIQELFLTWYVENALPKERIMELYLNVIEFGPGIYGITSAADHYFGKLPSELSSLEAAYLALMLPSPVRRYEHYCAGKLSRKFNTKLRRIHGLMFSRGHIDEYEHVLWKEAELNFDLQPDHNATSCRKQIKHLLESSHGQRAVSGLLGGDSGVNDGDDWLPFQQHSGGLRRLPVVDPAASDAPGVPAMDLD